MASCRALTDVLKIGGLPNLDDIVLRFGRGIVPNKPSDQGLADMLSACRKADDVSTYGSKWLPPTPARLNSEDFIDLDPVTNTLSPWLCESTLKVFRVNIARITCPVVIHTYHGFLCENNYQHDKFDNEPRLEDYPGQGGGLQ
ncbi:hypothetical protein BG015_005768 [Linnemannia schmuckeri]|uniref:Uncharacterized protein n=1 Tax=Linnemannia schmuckeri TaxID=64567 RepID=A0A9P5S0V6_9FUNG|nr:hypothetical protein BG015_005768 [Linnemannia schmuckeri]